MRLLNTQTFKLEEFIGHNVPQYAILSHTWGPDEVLYSDIVSYRATIGPDTSGVREKEGFRKIEMSCQRALRDSLSYVWIDTCCINKESSAELSEAINSMFRWYSRATVCYTYLADVGPDFEPIPDLGDGQSLSSREEDLLLSNAFSASRWFTRGWTLQELIAPVELKFYNRSFGFIGTKKSLAYLIKQITGIDESLLLGEQSIGNFCVARKMSWAAKRMTTREEDISYSLLGLFDIHMPLLYGEGNRAFIRLQEEILQHSNDESIFAWEDESKGSRTLIAPGPFSFSRCGKIVRWGRDDFCEPSRLTSRGINLRTPLVETMAYGEEPRRRALLGCRYEDNLLGPIGLNLQRMGRSGAYPLAQSGPKLSVVSLEDVAANPYKAVTVIDRYDPNADFERAVPIRGNRKCWIKFLGSSRNFNIIDAHPKKFWNVQCGTFIPPRGSNITTSVHFLREDGMEFILSFGYMREGALADTTQYYGEWVSLAKPVEGRTLHQMCIISSVEQNGDTRDEIQLSGTAQLRVEALTSMERVMDEDVYVISVVVKDNQ
jgi:hypothetical protein